MIGAGAAAQRCKRRDKNRGIPSPGVTNGNPPLLLNKKTHGTSNHNAADPPPIPNDNGKNGDRSEVLKKIYRESGGKKDDQEQTTI